jgi:hypothetical protein
MAGGRAAFGLGRGLGDRVDRDHLVGRRRGLVLLQLLLQGVDDEVHRVVGRLGGRPVGGDLDDRAVGPLERVVGRGSGRLQLLAPDGALQDDDERVGRDLEPLGELEERVGGTRALEEHGGLGLVRRLDDLTDLDHGEHREHQPGQNHRPSS